MSASVRPIAVIVRGPNETRAVNMDARPASIDRLAEMFPALETILACV